MATMTLTEARAALRKLTDWSDAVGRLKGVIEAAADLEENIATYDKMREALALESKKAKEAHDHTLAAFAVKQSAETQSLEDHKTHIALEKAELDKQLASERTAATKLVQVFKEKADEVMDRIRAEQTLLQRELEQTRKDHKLLMEDVQALQAERQKILRRFVSS